MGSLLSNCNVSRGLNDVKEGAALAKEQLHLDPDRINWDLIRWTWVRNIDEPFDNIKDILKNAEEIRENVIEAGLQMKEIAQLHYLKEGNLTDAIIAFYHAYAANTIGESADRQLNRIEVIHEPPYIELECYWMNQDVQKFNEYYKKYVKTCFEGPKLLEEMLEQMPQLVENCVALVANPSELSQQFSNLSDYWKLRGVKVTKDNISIVEDAFKKMKALKDKLVEAAQDMKQLIENLENLLELTAVKSVGEQAKKHNKLTPSDCLKEYSKKQKFSKEEVDKYLAEKEKKEKDIKQQREKARQCRDFIADANKNKSG